ncbi:MULTISPECIES: Crp/Fnr family transcriptional regulator [unclassified Pedobacter]|uniref:Crp/Fnr family transcriptional regulator n=1 Tax=Pedobacter TaxID=84567 RepID=UPI000B4A7E01|nr:MULTISPECIES: Crp/Fnr family transcriptional regulator [unclassified Pedobacter]MCX2430122.1 Crp/Fnr family transcriptional regulator [Pedobacter sp. GR22-10]OWK70397.1 hypothetical protein CBW18_13140 [Pedobacter sp. AJM]
MNANPVEEVEQLIKYLEQHGKVPKSMAAQITSGTKIMAFKKRKHLISPLDLYPNMYYILSGAVRGFARDNGKDVTMWIVTEGQIVGLTHFPKQIINNKSQFVETLEDCKVIVITNALVKTLLSEFPEMTTICRKLLWLHYHEAEERNYLIRLNSAIKRLNRMIDTCPDLYYRIPSKYLASYLGMRIETLSRLRSQMLHSHTT